MVWASRVASHGRGQIVFQQVGWILAFTEISAVQEGGATSSTDVAEQFPDPTEVGDLSKETVSVEQGQPLRAAEPDQCVLEVKAKSVLELSTQRQRDVLELAEIRLIAWYSAFVCGKDADDWHRRRRCSEMRDALGDRVAMTTEDGMVHKRVRFTVLMSHSDASVAAMAGPNDVGEKTVRVVCDRLKTWTFGVCTRRCQIETAQITLPNTTDKTTRVKTILRNAPWYLHVK